MIAAGNATLPPWKCRVVEGSVVFSITGISGLPRS